MQVLQELQASLRVVKRDGSIESFSVEKLRKSLEKACRGLCSENEIERVVALLIMELNGRSEIASYELVERIERLFMELGIEDSKWFEVAKRYELGRIYQDVYGDKWNGYIDPRDEELTFQAVKVLASRYLLKDPETGRFLETPQMLFRRVARAIAEIERIYCMKRAEPREKCEEVVRYWEEEFYRLLSERKFLPNSPTLMNAGTRLGILSACFVIPIRDAMVTPEGDGIYDALRAQAVIFQHGGGTGFDFSELRPEGDIVASTAGVASGPLSFMKVFDLNTDVIKQGGKRRGANMGVLHVWHADIEKFIDSKSGKLKDVNLQNFNISVGIYDYFMKAVLEGQKVPLVNPRKTNLRPDLGNNSKYYAITRARHYMHEEWVQNTILNELEQRGGSVWLDESILITIDEAMAIAHDQRAVTKYVDSRELFEKIVNNAWDSGDPGLLFIDTINRRHPVWYLGKINATNPCGEQPLLEWESCNLGSIDLSKYVYVDENGKPRIAWGELSRDLKVVARFMDNVIDAARWPLPQLEKAVKRTRKIGVGVMGWAHMLIKLGIPYDSVDALYLAYYLAEWIEYNLALASIELAKERGAFPAYDAELYRPTWITAERLEALLRSAGIDARPSKHVLELIADRPSVNWDLVEELRRIYGIRNACLTSIAPTGTISIIAGSSSGIEPLFAVAYERHVTVGRFIELDRLFLEYLKRYELDNPELIKMIAMHGSVSEIPFIPRSIRQLFKTAHDIEPKWHVLHQAVWQQWICAGVSKTINLRHDAKLDDVREAFLLAWILGCKGITVYRDRSKSRQVIYVGLKSGEEKRESYRGQKQGFLVTSGIGKPLSETIATALVQRGGCPSCEV